LGYIDKITIFATSYILITKQCFLLPMKRFLIIIITFINVSLLRAQETTFNTLLNKAYDNSIDFYTELWVPDYKLSAFHLINTYNPSNFRFDKSKLKEKIKGKEKIKLVNDSNGQFKFAKGLKKGHFHIGMPFIYLLGTDTLAINVHMVKCTSKKGEIFLAGMRYNFFDLSKSPIAEIPMSEDDAEILMKKYDNTGKTKNIDSLYYRLINYFSIELRNKGISKNKIYIYYNNLPNYLEDYVKGVDMKHRILEGHNYKHYLKDDNWIIGWPTIEIKNNKLYVTMLCINASGEKLYHSIPFN
jgi:hypothetical protein